MSIWIKGFNFRIMFHELKTVFRLIKMCKRIIFAMTSAYKLLQNENFRTILFTTEKNLIIQILLISRNCFAIRPITKHRKFVVCTNKLNKKSDSPVKLREKMLNFIVKYCENCMFCRAQVIIRGKTSHISWRHSTFLESSRQRRWSSAI